MEQQIIVLQGLPASGKSTYARELQATDPQHIVIVSRDDIRHARGVYWIPEQEEYISAIEEFMALNALDRGYSIIIDATNLNEKVLAKWKWMSTKYSIPITYKLFNTSVDECITRDSNPDRRHKVGERVIRSFYEKYKVVLNK